MTTPLGLALLFLMAVAPALPWRATTAEVLRDRLLFPAWAGGITMLVAVVLGAASLAEVLTFGLAAFVPGASPASSGSAAAPPAPAPGPLARPVRGRNPRLYGGLIVHTGIVIIAVAIAVVVGATRPPHGGSARAGRVGEGRALHRDLPRLPRSSASDQKNTFIAPLRVERGGDDLGVYTPAISTFPGCAAGHRHAVGAHRLAARTCTSR